MLAPVPASPFCFALFMPIIFHRPGRCVWCFLLLCVATPKVVDTRTPDDALDILVRWLSAEGHSVKATAIGAVSHHMHDLDLDHQLVHACRVCSRISC